MNSLIAFFSVSNTQPLTSIKFISCCSLNLWCIYGTKIKLSGFDEGRLSCMPRCCNFVSFSVIVPSNPFYMRRVFLVLRFVFLASEYCLKKPRHDECEDPVFSNCSVQSFLHETGLSRFTFCISNIWVFVSRSLAMMNVKTRLLIVLLTWEVFNCVLFHYVLSKDKQFWTYRSTCICTIFGNILWSHSRNRFDIK